MNPIASTYLELGDLSTTLFPPNSRYHGYAVQRTELPSGKRVAYVARRIVPLQERFETLREHIVVQGDRLDNVTAQYLGDPEQFWRLADANNDMNPFDLTRTMSRRLRITLPEGISTMPQVM
jgi:hypothetical protein